MAFVSLNAYLFVLCALLGLVSFQKECQKQRYKLIYLNLHLTTPFPSQVTEYQEIWLLRKDHYNQCNVRFHFCNNSIEFLSISQYFGDLALKLI